jgi:hypothetical protein
MVAILIIGRSCPLEIGFKHLPNPKAAYCIVGDSLVPYTRALPRLVTTIHQAGKLFSTF